MRGVEALLRSSVLLRMWTVARGMSKTGHAGVDGCAELGAQGL